MSDPIKRLAERGYRGKPELEAVDRELTKEYERIFAGQAKKNWWSKQDQTMKIFVGVGALMLLFFVCVWITNALWINQERQAAKDILDASVELIRSIIPRF